MSDIGEGPVAVIVKKLARGKLVPHKHIDVAVVVEIRPSNCLGPGGSNRQSGLTRDVGKGPVPIVPQQ